MFKLHFITGLFESSYLKYVLISIFIIYEITKKITHSSYRIVKTVNIKKSEIGKINTKIPDFDVHKKINYLRDDITVEYCDLKISFPVEYIEGENTPYIIIPNFYCEGEAPHIKSLIHVLTQNNHEIYVLNMQGGCGEKIEENTPMVDIFTYYDDICELSKTKLENKKFYLVCYSDQIFRVFNYLENQNYNDQLIQTYVYYPFVSFNENLYNDFLLTINLNKNAREYYNYYKHLFEYRITNDEQKLFYLNSFKFYEYNKNQAIQESQQFYKELFLTLYEKAATFQKKVTLLTTKNDSIAIYRKEQELTQNKNVQIIQIRGGSHLQTQTKIYFFTNIK